MTNFWDWLEIVAVGCGFLFLILIIRQKISCWFWGIVSSGLSVVIFFHARLYADMVLHLIYVGIGVYGWYNWNKSKKKHLPIIVWKLRQHIPIVLAGAVGSVLLGWTLHTYTNANNPYYDATISLFSIIASLLEARKILSTWIFWIALNGASVILYLVRDLEWYSGLMVVYTVFSVVGWLKWRKASRVA